MNTEISVAQMKQNGAIGKVIAQHEMGRFPIFVVVDETQDGIQVVHLNIRSTEDNSVIKVKFLDNNTVVFIAKREIWKKLYLERWQKIEHEYPVIVR